jgi:hypothetical protein
MINQYKLLFQNSNFNSARSVKYLIKKIGTMFTQQLKKYNVWLYQADTDNNWNNHMIKCLQS